jgi:hypothetical protein
MPTTVVQHWFKVNLGDAIIANQALAELSSALSNIYIAAGRPQNMQACYRHESLGIHCYLFVYLTQELQREVLLDNAVSCAMPDFADLCFLVGE